MRIFLISICILFIHVAHGQKSMLNDLHIQELIKKGLDKTYNYEFEEAQKSYEQVRDLYPEHPAYHFLMASNLFWNMQYNDSYKEKVAEYFGYLQASWNLTAQFLKKNPKDPEGIFFTMAIECYFALYYAERRETMKTLTHAKKAYSAMKEGFTLKDTYVDFYFSTGLYNYFVIQYPEYHPVYKPFMFIFAKGDKEGGLRQLAHCSENGVFLRTESLHYLSHILCKYESKYKEALKYSGQLVKRYPHNCHFIAQHVENLMALEEYKEAEVYSYKLYKTGKKSAMMKSYVFHGLLHEKHFDHPDESMKYYQAAVKLSQELTQPTEDFLSFAYAGMARLYHRQGNTDQAIVYYKKAKDIAEYPHIKKEIKEYLDKYD